MKYRIDGRLTLDAAMALDLRPLGNLVFRGQDALVDGAPKATV
jgi:hypothetical protein